MNIGILGAGHIGKALAQLFARAGHQVALSNSRGPETLEDTVRALGPNVRAMTSAQAAQFGELLVETIPFGKYASLEGLEVSGKVVIDTANYYPQRDGQIDLGGQSESSFMARHLPGARVVKAFNAIAAADLASQGDPGKPLEERRAIFVASDDPDAKRTVSQLIEAIGFVAVDTGTLEDSRSHQPGTAVYGKPLTGQQARQQLGTSG
ncbi:NADPH-dependent F420 reductase [Deinococcus sonorensis]|uniref:NADPH-dependent F420 reductase n=2 Tax=Deinococcus sonorensis TaxID=309891 RepID=A0AAU7U8F8_9DEIO